MPELRDVTRMNTKTIINRVKEAGVIGAGGAGFPTHLKIAASVDTVIVNGAECEPLLRVDQELMEKNTEELINGLEFVRETTGAERVIIALKAKYTKAIENIKKLINNKRIYDIQELEDFYPVGDEQQLLYEVTGRIVPEGGIPLQVGAVVINVETVININNALKQTPLTHKYLTISGAVKKPLTLLVPVGTLIKELLSVVGGTTVTDFQLLDGGPMMGKIVSPDAPVKKTTKGVLVLPEGHLLIRNKNTDIKFLLKRAMSVCAQCRACTDVCPRYLLGHSLEPHRIMRSISYGIDSDSEVITSALLCCECGVCDTWGCPMGLSPRIINMHIKDELLKRNYKNTHNLSPEETYIMREFRKVPAKRLIRRLDIHEYDRAAPLDLRELNPERVELYLQQHIGDPSKPVVNVGEAVNKGQLIAKAAEASPGANIHTGISGRVRAVTENSVIIER